MNISAPPIESKMPDEAATGQGTAIKTTKTTNCTFDVLDMHCAGCAAMIEDALAKIPGVQKVSVHYATQRARVSFDASRVTEVSLLERVGKLGYSARLNNPSAEATQSRSDFVRGQRRQIIWRFGIAAFCTMQVMMFTLPRFLAGSDMEAELGPLLDWAGLLLTLPMAIGCGMPFYRGALREFRLRRPGMDSAITISVVFALFGSVWHLWAGTGALYFDSITMFITLLLGARWLEWEQREKNLNVVQNVSQEVAIRTALRVCEKSEHREQDTAQGVELAAGLQYESVPAEALKLGDWVWVANGEALPVDGQLPSDVAHQVWLDESLLTGESGRAQKHAGDYLMSGAVNVGEGFIFEVTATWETSTERRLMALADNANKPESLNLADNVARYFMPALFVVSAATFFIHRSAGVSLALERMISVLIISCPCALALAAPSAYARAFAGFLSRGLVLRRADAVARLARANVFLIDKTGTLTTPSVAKLRAFRPEFSEAEVLSHVVCLEAAANHPIAAAIRALPEAKVNSLHLSEMLWTPGEGVSGSINRRKLRFGRASFVGIDAATIALMGVDEPVGRAALWLFDEFGPLGMLSMGEAPVPSAKALVDALKARGEVEILSGDEQQKTNRAATELGVMVSGGGYSPEGKAARVAAFKAAGKTTVMIGDGVNDSVGFAGADVAIAVYSATAAARLSADLICINPAVTVIVDAAHYADKVTSVVRSNFIWAGFYNVVAIPFAMAGYVNPLWASVGMALSSLIVVLNVMRLDLHKQ